MSQPLLISGALANVGGDVTTEDLLNFLSKHLSEAEFYKITEVTAAALDWRVVLQDTAAITTIASALWLGYTAIVAPTKKEPDSSAGIYIVVGNAGDENSQFWIGNEYKDKDIFIENFTKRVKEVTETENSQGEITREILETEESSHWLKVK